jgi:hypothetical protein
MDIVFTSKPEKQNFNSDYAIAFEVREPSFPMNDVSARKSGYLKIKTKITSN